MVFIYDKNSRDFNTAGLGTLIPSSCVVSEELNGSYELKIEHPYDQWDKWKRIDTNNIIVADTPIGRQPFRVYAITPTMEGISVNARHIFYDLLDNLCSNININSTAVNVLNNIVSSMNLNMPFDFSTDITKIGSIVMENENPVTALLSDDDDSPGFVKVFGGEILRDGFNVNISNTIGADKGVTIAYGKNLVGLEVEEDISDVATRVYPIGEDELQLSGGYIDSQYIHEYPYPKIKVLEVSGATTQEDLRAAVTAFFEEGGDTPKVNIKVEFQELSQTEEYKNYAKLQAVFLGDIVTIYNPKMNFSKKAKVIGYEYDSLMHRYNSVELGDFSSYITSAVTSGLKSAGVAQRASAEAKATNVLISGTVTITNTAQYICIDGDTVEESTKLFEFGKNGLRFSSTGVSGTWKTIIDSDGNVV